MKDPFNPTATDKVVEVSVICTGDYATAIVTQDQRIPQLNVPIVADLRIESAKRAYQLAGFNESQILVARNRAQALAGVERGQRVVVDLPLDVSAEATGDTAAGAIHALSALKNGKHVVMITKETEAVEGPFSGG